MSLVTNISALVARVSTEFRSIRTLLSGSATGGVSGLQTSATNVVDAINEVQASAAAAAVINDSVASPSQTYSSNKIEAVVSEAVADVVGASPASLDTLNEIAAALNNDANIASTLTNAIALKANSADVYTKSQADTLVASAGSALTITVFQHTDAVVFADSSRTPQPDPAGRSGWYFKNISAGQKINWYPFANAANSSLSLGGVTSLWMVAYMATTTTRLLVSIYTARQNDGLDAASWYRSRVVYDMPVGQVPAAGAYLIYWGADPGVHPELPRIAMNSVASSISTRGPRGAGERVSTYAWGTNSISAINTEEFTGVECGHKIGTHVLKAAFNHIGPVYTITETNALFNGATLVPSFESALNA